MNLFVKLRISSFYPAIIWLLVITVMLILPGNHLPDQPIILFPHFDKVIHVVFFFFLTFLYCRPLQSGVITFAAKNYFFLMIAIASLMYGIIIEFIQKYFVPNRSYDNGDILADGIGSLTAYLWCLRIAVRQRGDHKKP